MVGSFLLFQWQHKLKSLGAFVVPFAMIVMTASSFQSREILPLPPVLKSIWLPIHAIICLSADAIFADAIFALAFCIAIMYLLQERQIKKKRLGAVFQRLPSLETLEALPDHGVSPVDTGDNNRVHLGREGLGILLELGPKGNMVTYHLVYLCSTFSSAAYSGLAGAKGCCHDINRFYCFGLYLPGSKPVTFWCPFLCHLA